MRNEGMLAATVRILNSIREKVTGEGRLGETDSAVLKVAMMISALDGDVSGEELEAFNRLARKCRGFSVEEADRVFDEGLRLAGYLVLQRQRLNEKRLIDLFVSEADGAMPGGFAVASPVDVRKAFVMWMTMALADGEYSPVERKALDALRKHLDAIAQCVSDYQDNCRMAVSPAFSHAFVFGEAGFRFKSAATDAFLAKVETLVTRLGNPQEAEAAAHDLKVLISEG